MNQMDTKGNSFQCLYRDRFVIHDVNKKLHH